MELFFVLLSIILIIYLSRIDTGKNVETINKNNKLDKEEYRVEFKRTVRVGFFYMMEKELKTLSFTDENSTYNAMCIQIFIGSIYKAMINHIPNNPEFNCTFTKDELIEIITEIKNEATNHYLYYE